MSKVIATEFKVTVSDLSKDKMASILEKHEIEVVSVEEHIPNKKPEYDMLSRFECHATKERFDALMEELDGNEEIIAIIHI